MTTKNKLGNLFVLSADEIEHVRNSFAGCRECIKAKQHWLCNSNNELYIGYKESVIAPFAARNREIKSKYEEALCSYKVLKGKYEEAVKAYQKLKNIQSSRQKENL